MDCIPYINDLQVEIKILKDIKANQNCNTNEIDKKIQEKERLIDICKNNLSKLTINSIEYRLYLKILNGKSPTKAVEEVAEENYLNDIKPSSIRPIWEKYKNMKNIINFCLQQ